MKRSLLCSAAVIATSMFCSGIALAATSDTCAMTVTVTVSAGVEVSDTLLAFGSLAAGDTTGAVSDAAASVTNNGTTTQSYQLQVTEKPSQWGVRESAGNPADEEFKLFAMFATGTPATGDFLDTEDVVKETGGATNATADVYAKNDQAVSVKGYSCSATSVRNLWFRFVPPASTTLGGSEQWITVTVTAY